MNQGQLVFAQLMQHLPLTTSRRCVGRYHGDHKVQSFSCLDQFLSMAFAPLTYRESLRDIEACVCRCFRGRRSARPRLRSNCTPCGPGDFPAAIPGKRAPVLIADDLRLASAR